VGWRGPQPAPPRKLEREPASVTPSGEPDFDAPVALALVADARHLHPTDLGEMVRSVRPSSRSI
jgi:hypothetical protein